MVLPLPDFGYPVGAEPERVRTTDSENHPGVNDSVRRMPSSASARYPQCASRSEGALRSSSPGTTGRLGLPLPRPLPHGSRDGPRVPVRRDECAIVIGPRCRLGSPWAALALFAFLLNFAWEVLQVPFYRGIKGAPHWDATLACLRPTFGDVAITGAAYWHGSHEIRTGLACPADFRGADLFRRCRSSGHRDDRVWLARRHLGWNPRQVA